MFLSFRVRVLLPLWLSWHVPWCSTCEWRTLRLSNGCAGKKTFLFLCLFIFIFWKSYFDQIFTSLISPSILLVFSCCFWSLPKLCMVFCGSVKSTSWLLICTLTVLRMTQVWVTWYHLSICQLVESLRCLSFDSSGKWQLAESKLAHAWHPAPQWPLRQLWLMAPSSDTKWQRQQKQKTKRMLMTLPTRLQSILFFCIFRSVLRPWFCLSFSYRFFSPT